MPIVTVHYETVDFNDQTVTVGVQHETGGGFSTFVPSLPGACGQGDNKEDALESIRGSLEALAQSYRDEGRAIPWIGGTPA